MDESDLVKELSRRTSVSEETAAAVLKAAREMVHEGALEGAALAVAPTVPPDDPGLVDRLIAKAKKHPLGLEFLASGLLATVAITLGAHAFTVEAARRRLRKEQEAKEKEPQPA